MDSLDVDRLEIVMPGLFGSSSEFSAHDRALLRRVEQKLDLILGHLGIAVAKTSGLPEDVRALADAGEKIAAIKALREMTGLGLKAAKDEVDKYLAGGG